MSARNRQFAFWMCSALLACLYMSIPRTASASTGSKYVALRKRYHYDRKLTYAQVQANPVNYIGDVFELRGTVGGVAETTEGLSLMLNLPDRNAPTLDIPRAEAGLVREYNMPTLRVLVKVGAGSGNYAPLTVLAVAHDSEVSVLEAEAAAAAQQAEYRSERQRWQEAAARSIRKRRTTQLASRGDFIRSLSGDAYTALTTALRPQVRPLFVPYFNFIMSYNSSLQANQAGLIAANLIYFADQYHVDPRLIVAMIIAESGFNPNATSRVGAMGLGQLMPGTARALGVANPYDPGQNLGGSIAYLRSRLDTFADKALPGGGVTFDQVALAMAAYNAGTNAVRKFNGIPPYHETQAYVRRVLSLYQQLCQ